MLIYATKWMKCENIMLSENQTEKPTYHMIPFYFEISRIGKFTKDSTLAVSRVKRQGCWRWGLGMGNGC